MAVYHVSAYKRRDAHWHDIIVVKIFVKSILVEGNVYGCSYYAEDDNPSDPHDPTGWASFVNISGGTIGIDAKGGIEKGNVYGAGYGGKVKGSVAVLIGQNAIVETSNDSGDEFYNP